MAAPCAPVLLLIFNRPELAAQAAAALRPARPARVYVAADGPRAGRDDEPEKCERARKAVLGAIDWPCEVRTLLRDENLGCARAVHGAVSWFFEHEAEGIVLEDDCLAAPAFFPFCTELLARYRDERRVFAICGDNFVDAETPPVPSYWFGRVFHTWGWASWRDRWSAVPRVIDAPDAATIRAGLRRAGLSRPEVDYWAPIFARVRRQADVAERIDSWAYPVAHQVFVDKLLCICPARNLVVNEGFGADSTHFAGTTDGAGMRVAAAGLAFPLSHPRRVALNRALNRRNLQVHFGVPPPRPRDLLADLRDAVRSRLDRAP